MILWIFIKYGLNTLADASYKVHQIPVIEFQKQLLIIHT